TTDNALLLAAFVALGRIFDQRSRHNVDRLLKIASEDLGLFSKAALVRRKEAEGLPSVHAAPFAEHAFEPTAADFRLLRKDVAERRRAYEARYRDVRDKIFAHNEIADIERTNEMFAKTNIEEMKGIFAFLHALHEALWQLLYNGRELTLRID